MLRVLIFLVSLGARAIRAMCRRRADLVIENLALRQQLTALKKERPRPPLEDTDRAFWVALRSSWPAWASRLVIVNADTVARWNRDRFRRYWARISRRRYPGRPRIDAEIRRLVHTMAQDGWGAPRIHAELTKLGFVVSEMTVSLRLMYGFFVIEHGRRHILHFNATYNPTSAWVIQQLREAFPYDTAPRYLVFDRDAIFSPAVVEFIRAHRPSVRRPLFEKCAPKSWRTEAPLTVSELCSATLPLSYETHVAEKALAPPLRPST